MWHSLNIIVGVYHPSKTTAKQRKIKTTKKKDWFAYKTCKYKNYQRAGLRKNFESVTA